MLYHEGGNMGNSYGHSGGGFLSRLLRGILSRGNRSRANFRKRRNAGRRARLLAFEGCEDRRMLAVTAAWDAGTGTLSLTGDASNDAVSLIGQTSYVDIYYAGKFQARMTGPNSNNVNTISFDAKGGTDSLTVQNIQPNASVAIDLKSVESLAVTKSKNVAVTRDAALIFGTTSITGTLSVGAGGGLTQTGAMVVGGAATLNAGTSDILLSNPANNFLSVAVTAADDVSLKDVNSLILGASTVAGNLSVQASLSSSSRGSITQSGVLDVTGNTILAVGAASTITLGSDNVLDGTIYVTGGNTILKNTVATNFGASNIAGNLTVTTTNDNITQSEAVVATKIASFNTGTADITLNNAANNFGTLTIAAANDVWVKDSNALVLGAIVLNDVAGPPADASSLEITTVGAITQTGGLVVPGTTTLNVGAANNITLSRTDNNFGGAVGVYGRAVTLRNSNAIVLGACTVTGTLGVTSNGAITETSGIDVTGKLTLAAGFANDINLSTHDNSLGLVAITSGANVSLKDTDGDLTLAASKISGTLGLETTDGSITQTGALVVTGATTLTVPTTGDITLTTATNNFSSVSIVSGRNASLTDTNALVLGAIDIVGNLIVNAKGALTQTAAILVDGTTTLTSSSTNSITLDNAGNDLTGAVSVVAGGNVLLTNTGGIVLAAMNLKGNLTVVAGGAITQSGPLTVAKLASFDAGVADVTLQHASNNFRTIAFPAAGNVSVVDTDALALGASTIGGTLAVTAGKGITQSGILDVTGAATLAAGTLDSIALNSFDNSLSSVGFTAGGSVTLQEADGVDLAASTVGGALAVTAGGAITDSGALSIKLKATFDAGTDDITLDNAGNNFSEVAITAGGAVTLTDSNDLSLAGVNADSLILTAGGALVQTGAVSTANGVELLVADDITLTNPANWMNITMTVSAINVSIVNSTNVDFGDSTIAGNLSVQADGDITNTGTLSVTGTATLDAGASNDITLNSVGNDFNEVTVTAANAVTLVDSSELRLGPVSANTLTVTTSGDLDQIGVIAVVGTTTLDVAGNVTLDNSSNTFHIVKVTATGDDVLLVNGQSIVLGDSSIDGNLSVEAAGTINDGGGVVVGGTATFIAKAAGVDVYYDIALVYATSQYTGEVSLTGKNITLIHAHDTVLGETTAKGYLTVDATGDLVNSSDGIDANVLTVSDKTTLSATEKIDLFWAGSTFDGMQYDAAETAGMLVLDAPVVVFHPGP
jgi:hypothetical protein